MTHGGGAQTDLFKPEPSPPGVIREAELRRELGIERSGGRAERIDPGWIDAAVGFLTGWINHHQGEAPFLADFFVCYADNHGFPAPPDGRAWGAVFRRAQARGVIKSVGYAPSPSSNMSPKVLWKAEDANAVARGHPATAHGHGVRQRASHAEQ